MKELMSGNTIKRNFITIIMIIILAGLFVINHIYKNEEKNDMESFDSFGENFTIQTKNALKILSYDQLRVAKSIAVDPIIVEACKEPQNIEKLEKADKYIKNIAKTHTDFEYVSLSLVTKEPYKKNINGKIIAMDTGSVFVSSLGDKGIGKELDYANYIVKSKDGVLSDVNFDEMGKELLIVMGAPIIDELGNTIGVAYVSPRVSSFVKNYIEDVRYNESGLLFITDSKGEVLAQENTEDRLSGEMNETLDFLKAEKVQYKSNYKGEKYGYYSKKVLSDQIYSKELYAVFSMKSSDIFINSKRSRFTLIVGFIIMLILLRILMYRILEKEKYINEEENLLKEKEELEIEIKDKTKTLDELALKDSMTGLYNYRTIFNILEREKEKFYITGEKFSIIGIKIDKFKKINEKFGYTTGDEVIIKISKKLIDACGAGEYPGIREEKKFVMILTNTNLSKAILKADDFRKSIEFLKFEKELEVTVSIGVAEFSDGTIDEIVDKVDIYTDKAEESGCDRVVSE